MFDNLESCIKISKLLKSFLWWPTHTSESSLVPIFPSTRESSSLWEWTSVAKTLAELVWRGSCVVVRGVSVACEEWVSAGPVWRRSRDSNRSIRLNSSTLLSAVDVVSVRPFGEIKNLQAIPRAVQLEHGSTRLHLSFLERHDRHETGSGRVLSFGILESEDIIWRDNEQEMFKESGPWRVVNLPARGSAEVRCNRFVVVRT